ncbi:MAG: PAS domain S-box protein [Bacteroidetes bacterium]|nr:PAS domain S-box protein [Bacteroidota bacterium]
MKKHLLIIEDDKVDQMAFERMAKISGFPFTYKMVGSIADALVELKNNSFDAIVTDYFLGDGTAFEILEMNISMPIIVVTGTGTEEIAVDALKKGAYDYLIKDVEGYYLTMLPITVQNALYRFNAENELKEYHANLAQIVEKRTAELRESEERFRELVEMLPEAVFETDQNFIITYVNQRALELTGYTLEDIDTGISGIDFLVPEHRERAKENIAMRMKGINPGTIEYLALKKDGSCFPILFHANTIFNNGKLMGIRGIIVDITERVEAEGKITKLSRAVEQSPSVITITDLDGIHEYVNPKFTKLTGYTTEEVIGKSTRILKSGKQSHDFYRTFWETISSGQEWHGEFINMKKNGELFWEKASVSPIINNEGVITNYIKLAEDITGKKKSEQIQRVLYNISNAVITSNNLEKLILRIKEELETIIDTTNFYVALYDEETDSFSLPFHIDQKDKVSKFPAGKSLTAWVVKTKKSLLVTKNVKTKLIEDGDVEIFGADSKVWLGVPLIVNGKVTGAYAVQSYEDEYAYNESDLRVLEFVSDQISIAIERKKAEDDLIEALEKSTESDRLKTAFLQNISHEIRTPMNGIMGFASLLKDREMSGIEQQTYIDIIMKSGNRMLNTLTDLMDISMLETGMVRLNFSIGNVNTKLKNLYEFFKPEAETKGLKINFSCPLPDNEVNIRTDRQKFIAILTNLIKNSIKYSHKGNIDFGYNKKGNFLEFYVKDNGIGIPNDRQLAIFERFVQADIEDIKVYEGSGLGLSISHSYVDMLGGKIWVESIDGQGSEFYFTIPHNTPDKETKESEIVSLEEKVGNIAKKLKILIAEDEDISDRYLTIILDSISPTLLHASNGKEAIELCRNNNDIDLILMDIKMPITGGYEATKEIRKFNKDIIIIAQTAYSLPGDNKKAIDAGCNDYISKPIKKELLMGLIEKYFGVEQ